MMLLREQDGTIARLTTLRTCILVARLEQERGGIQFVGRIK
jgi:hypothetical protein